MAAVELYAVIARLIGPSGRLDKFLFDGMDLGNRKLPAMLFNSLMNAGIFAGTDPILRRRDHARMMDLDQDRNALPMNRFHDLF